MRVVPRARKTELAGWRGDAVVIRLSAPPVDGAANQALIEFLSRRLNVPRQSIRLVAGERARLKRVAIDGVSAASVATLFGLH